MSKWCKIISRVFLASFLCLSMFGTVTRADIGSGVLFPIGSDGEISFNDGGIWGSSGTFVYTKADDLVTVSSMNVVYVEISTTQFNGVTYNWPQSKGTSGQVLGLNGALDFEFINAGGSGGASTLEVIAPLVRSSPTATINFSAAFTGLIPAFSSITIGIDPSSVSVLNASGFVPNAQLDPSSVTKLGTSIDISDETNLAVDAPLVLTDDTLSVDKSSVTLAGLIVDISTKTNLTVTSPIILTNDDISIQDADDDGATKGAASFDNTNFNATSGNVTIADDGHNHTGITLSGIDMSDDTNLAVTAALTFVGDTIGVDSSSVSVLNAAGEMTSIVRNSSITTGNIIATTFTVTTVPIYLDTAQSEIDISSSVHIIGTLKVGGIGGDGSSSSGRVQWSDSSGNAVHNIPTGLNPVHFNEDNDTVANKRDVKFETAATEYMLFVDGDANAVAIGTDTATSTLTVLGSFDAFGITGTSLTAQGLFITNGYGSSELLWDADDLGNVPRLILHRNKTTSLDIGVQFKLYGGVKSEIVHITGVGNSVYVSSPGGSLTNRINSSDQSMRTSILVSNSGFHVDPETMTFIGPGTDPVLNWATSGELILSAGIFRIEETDTGFGVSADADNFIVESGGNTGITITAGASSTANIFMGDSNFDVCRLVYNHNGNIFSIWTLDALRLTLDHTQADFVVPSVTMGSDSGGGTRTDATRKIMRLYSPHYTNAEEPVIAFLIDSDGTDNIANFGDGTANGNKATEIRFNVAENDTTVGSGAVDSSNMKLKGVVGGAVFTIGTAGTGVDVSSFGVNGSLTFVGEAGLPYADMFAADVNDTITIASTGKANKVQITSFVSNGVSNNITPDHTNDHITIVKPGIYLCNLSLHALVAGSAANYGYSVYKNNGATEFTNLHGDKEFASGDGEGSMSVSGLIDLAVNDTIEVWIWNNTSTDDIAIDDANLSLIQVGGT